MLLASPSLNCSILRALAAGPMQQTEIRQATASPAQTTLRAQLKKLSTVGAIAKRRRNRFPGVLEYELTVAGQELLFVSDVLEEWLQRTAARPLALEGNAAKAATKALTEGWTSTITRVLAAGPASLTQLDSLIGAYSYPSLERRLSAMRLAGLVEAHDGRSKGRPHAATTWLRLGIAPLLAGARWERRHLPQATVPIARLDVEAAFMLAAPLMRLSREVSGVCRIAAEITDDRRRRLAGITLAIESGQIASCTTQVDSSVDSSALASPTAWFEALVDGDSAQLELGGNGSIARAILDGLHRSLFAADAFHAQRD